MFQILTLNSYLDENSKARKVVWKGRTYWVANATLIVPGVLPGSKGPILYLPEDIRNSVDMWNGVPIVAPNHPVINGMHVSARSPSVLERYGVGNVYNASIDAATSKLRGELWFDEESVENISKIILIHLKGGQKVEISTGLGLDIENASPDSVYNCPLRNFALPYTGVARNYRPDHLAVLPDGIGACSVSDGCGIFNEANSVVSPLVSPLPVNSDCECKELSLVGQKEKVTNSFFSTFMRWMLGTGGSLNALEPITTIENSVCEIKDGVCVNCGGVGSGKPGPCPGSARGGKKDGENGAKKVEDKSTLKVNVDESSKSLISKFFGDKASPEQVARLVGAQPGSINDLSVNEEGVLSIASVLPKVYECGRELKVVDGKLVCVNNDITVFDKGKGLGTKIFSEQVQAMSSAGVSRIECAAVRDEDEGLNGYYTWARLGYDGSIPEEASLSEKFRSAKTVQELMAMPGGQEEWKENGATFNGTFSLEKGSRSMEILDAYIAESKSKKTANTSDTSKDGKSSKPSDKKKIEEIDLNKEEETYLDNVWKKLLEKSTTNISIVLPKEEKESIAMNKEQLIQWLTVNCDCWKGSKAKDALNVLTDAELLALKTKAEEDIKRQSTFNSLSTPKDITVEGKVYLLNSLTGEVTPKALPTPPITTPVAAPVPVAPPSPTFNDLLSAASPEDRAAWNMLQETIQREKIALVEMLTANRSGEDKTKRMATLSKLTVNELRELAADVRSLLPVQQQPQQIQQGFGYGVANPMGGFPPAMPSYLGANAAPPYGSTVANSQQDRDAILEIPTINWAEKD